MCWLGYVNTYKFVWMAGYWANVLFIGLLIAYCNALSWFIVYVAVIGSVCGVKGVCGDCVSILSLGFLVVMAVRMVWCLGWSLKNWSSATKQNLHEKNPTTRPTNTSHKLEHHPYYDLAINLEHTQNFIHNNIVHFNPIRADPTNNSSNAHTSLPVHPQDIPDRTSLA